MTAKDGHPSDAREEEAVPRIVLVAEDDPMLRDGLVTLLRDYRWEVHGAADGCEALALMRAHPIEVVLTDLLMPRMDGLQLLGRIREIDPELPVIVLTGFGTLDRCAQLLRAGATDFLTKPCDEDVLLHVLSDAILSRCSPSIPDRIRDATSGRMELKIPATADLIAGVVAEVEAVAKAVGYYARRWCIRRALQEGLENAVRHGAAGVPNGEISISLLYDGSAMVLRVLDPGRGFDKYATASGHGLALIRGFADKVVWHPPGNCLEMSFARRMIGLSQEGEVSAGLGLDERRRA